MSTTAYKIRETSGPTVLVVGAVADGEYLRRSGSSVVGGSPGGAGAPPTQVVVDLGSGDKTSGSFVVVDAALTPSSRPQIWEHAGEDELGDFLLLRATAASGSMTVYWMSLPGPVHGNHTFNYTLGN